MSGIVVGSRFGGWRANGFSWVSLVGFPSVPGRRGLGTKGLKERASRERLGLLWARFCLSTVYRRATDLRLTIADRTVPRAFSCCDFRKPAELSAQNTVNPRFWKKGAAFVDSRYRR